MTVAPTVFSAGTTLTGRIDVPGDVWVRGTIRGELFAGGLVAIDVGAVVHGEVRGARVHVRGRLSGRAIADEWIRIAASAVVDGELVAPTVEREPAKGIPTQIEMAAPSIVADAQAQPAQAIPPSEQLPLGDLEFPRIGRVRAHKARTRSPKRRDHRAEKR